MAGELPPVLGGAVSAPGRASAGSAGGRDEEASEAPGTESKSRLLTGLVARFGMTSVRSAIHDNKETEVKNSGTFNITAHGDREIVVMRVFDAPRQLVFDAYTKPELVKTWLLGPDGWSMPVCEIDLRAGGKYRYVWENDSDGREMGMGGIYREVVAPERIVATEEFDEAWYPGEALDTIVLSERGGQTTLTQTILYNSRATRDAVLRSPMQTGMAASYDKLEKALPALRREALSA